jgi:hypothetical protein
MMTTRAQHVSELILASILALAIFAAGPTLALAHAGEAHPDDGLDLTTMLGVAGVVAALGIAWLLTNRIPRSRDIHGDEENQDVR